MGGVPLYPTAFRHRLLPQKWIMQAVTVIFMNLSDSPGEKILLDTFDLLFRVGFQDYCISQKVFIKSSCKSQLPQISVNLSFIFTYMKKKLTDLCGNWLLQNNVVNAFCEMM